MKNSKYNYSLIGSLGLLIILLTISCTRDEDLLVPATFPTSPGVFLDGFSGGLEYQAFGDSKLTAFEVVSDVTYSGQAAMRFEVPNEGDPAGSYAGGILTDLGGRDLSGYNALTFWVKGSQAATIGTIGFGTDFINDKYTVSLNNIDLSTSWRQYVIPIPDPSLLTQEKGMFLFSDGPDDGNGYTLWIDEVQFENIDNLDDPRATILNGEDVTQQTFIGVGQTIGGLSYSAKVPSGINETVIPAPGYFSFISSDTIVAKVDDQGRVSILSTGTAVITASTGGLDAIGSLTIESIGEFTSAPAPTRNAADVISLFSDAYTNVPVDFYNGYYAPFQTTLGQDDINVNGNNIIKYTELNFVGSEFKDPTVDASTMTHLHIDFRIENDLVAGDFIKIELADYGADGTKDGTDNSAGSVIFTAPTLVSGDWVGLDMPLADFAGLAGTSSLWQLIFVTEGTNPNATGSITDLLVDNIYFYKDDGGGGGDCTAEMSESLAATDFNLTFQTDPGASVGSFDALLTTVDNPDSDNAVNSSCKVGKIDRSGSALFANNQIDFDTKFDFNANAGFKMKVWSPTAGTNVLVKLEDKTNNAVNSEIGAVTTVAAGWEELSFDFTSDDSGKFDKIILFFELNTNTTETYYIDDFALYGGGGGGAMCTAETSESLAATDFNLSFQNDPGASVASFDAALSTVDNPDFENAVNTSCKVGQIDRAGGALFANNQIDFDAKFDFNANAGFKMKVWSPTAGTNVLVKLEDKTNNTINTEIAAVTTMAGAWEELTFDFGSGESGKYDKIILFFELNTNTTETYYIDDFALYGSGGGGGGGSAATFPLDFEDGLLFFNAFEGATVAVIDNPQTMGNASSKVLELVKPNGVRFFAGINSDPALNGPMIDLANGLLFTAKVWSPKAGISVRARLEQEPGISDPPAFEIFQTVANANEWTTLTFDFSTTAASSSASYTRLVLNTDWDTDPAGGETFYIDDIEQGNAPAVCMPETSESLDAADFNLSFQNDPGASISSFDAALSTVDNPDFDNMVNNSCKVGQIDRSGGALFANNQIDFNSKFDFNANSGFKMKVWSPNAGTNVLVKLEDKTNNTINTEIGAVTTTAGAWEELTFDFGSGESGKYDKIILFFELNTNTTETYYIDDFALYSDGGGGTGGNFITNDGFETGDDTGWLFFDNGGTTAVIADASNGSSFTAKITSGPTNNPGIKQERFGAGTFAPNQEIEFTLDSKVETLLDGAIVKVFAFSESATAGVGAVQHELGSVNTSNGDWNANTFTFMTAADVSGGLSILVEVVCGGAATCSGVVYFDNVSVTIK